MTKTTEMMKATKKLEGFEENSSLLFEYVNKLSGYLKECCE